VKNSGYKLNDIIIDFRIGVSGDIFINESYEISGDEIEMDNNNNDLVLSFISGIGVGYVFTDKIKAGIKTTLSRTLTNIYKKSSKNDEMYFINIQNILYIALLF